MNKQLTQLIGIILYRLDRSVQNASEGYYDFKAGNDSRSPLEILTHLVDVSHYGLSILNAPKPVDSEYSVFEKVMENFQVMAQYLGKNRLDEEITTKLINGPLSDALTHIGQLTFLRRLEGNPIAWENYTNAET